MATTVDKVTLKTNVFKVSLAISRGETFNKSVAWKTGATEGAAALVDLTGYTARADVRADKDSATVLLHMDTSNGRIVLGDAAGTIAIVLSSTETSALTFDKGVWDLELVAPDGSVIPKLAGSVSILGEVTRPEGEP